MRFDRFTQQRFLKRNSPNCGRRINATKWPERRNVTDASQGVQLATIQALARYWATDYDWRKCEARLSALPQFIHRDRRTGHSFPSRPFKTRKCVCR